MAYKINSTFNSTVKPFIDKYGVTNPVDFVGQGVEYLPKWYKGGITATFYPIESLHWQQGKYKGLTSYNNLYYRILTNKIKFNFGIITGEKGEVFSLWNGYEHPITLTNIENVNASGVSVVPVNNQLPITFAPYRSVLLQMAVSTNGAATINGSFNFYFDNGDKVKIYVYGSRLVLLNVVPNWDSNFVETFEYNTDVLTSYNKKEQRRSLLSQPRRKVRYSALIQGEVLMQLRNKLHGWHNRAFMLPLWYQMGRLVSGGQIGSTVIEVAENKYDFVAGASICLWQDFNVNELFEIISVSGTTLTLNAPISNNFVAGAKVFPCMNVRMSEQHSIVNATNTVAHMEFELVADQASLKLPMPKQGIPTTYKGVEVLERKPNWASEVSDEFQASVSMVDYEYGIQQWFSKDSPSLATRKQTYVMRTYDEILWWKAFIHRQLGRLTSFYVPSWTTDLVKKGDYIAGSLFFDVRDDNLSTIVAASNDRKILRVVANNQVYYLTIVAVVSANGLARIVLETPINANILEKQFTQISFMQRCRLASDEIEFNYITRDTVELSLNLQQIREV